ncbi:MAG: response regulator [Bacteroidetes bacterium]|nr:response regulator [Bacteroidota bacterium]MBU1113969.1 response regulator [Bacteroidota bacterium]MBU1797303.1 response regulator [Bacteroidota bacterium]
MKKVLVVDDQKDNVFVLEDRLKREGYEILKAYNGKDCIEIAEGQLPDLILLDVMMPGLSGFEVCKILTTSKITKNIPVILVTALNEAADLNEGFIAGAFDYIKKPFNRIELIARVKAALRFSELQNVMLEFEKIRTFSATVSTANHEIKQPLTLINLSTAALNRELGKDEINKEAILKRIGFIEDATRDIISVLDKLSAIKSPVLTDWVNDVKLVDLSNGNLKNN